MSQEFDESLYLVARTRVVRRLVAEHGLHEIDAEMWCLAWQADLNHRGVKPTVESWGDGTAWILERIGNGRRPGLPARRYPYEVISRAGSHLTMARRGLEDMEGTDTGRILYGFSGVAVFGYSVILALHKLKGWDRNVPAPRGERTFTDWYEPWSRELTEDPLLIFFREVRDSIVHEIEPTISILLGYQGHEDRRIGEITIERDLPRTHRGKPIEDRSTANLSRLWLAFLKEMFESGAILGWEINDRYVELHPDGHGPAPGPREKSPPKN